MDGRTGISNFRQLTRGARALIHDGHCHPMHEKRKERADEGMNPELWRLRFPVDRGRLGVLPLRDFQLALAVNFAFRPQATCLWSFFREALVAEIGALAPILSGHIRRVSRSLVERLNC